ncbi:MAG: ribonuclease P protein component [Rhodobacteraceae bacterium]|jgi:ribonuclease P protein component|nr:ribonuclease P protein component [Paracoccaceae bacterium]
MTPPEARAERHTAEAPAAPSAVSVCLQVAVPRTDLPPPGPVPVIPRRADFLKAAAARRQGTASFLLQARDRRDGQATMRMGFTASKKTGNSVTRNSARRRLREAARAVLPELGRAGWDYVLVARPGATVTRPYAALLDDLRAALASVHRPPRPKGEDRATAAGIAP